MFDIVTLSFGRSVILLAVFWGHLRAGPRSLGIAYAVFRLNTIGSTVFASVKLALFHADEWYSPSLALWLPIFSILMAWVESAIPYFFSAQNAPIPPAAQAQLPPPLPQAPPDVLVVDTRENLRRVDQPFPVFDRLRGPGSPRSPFAPSFSSSFDVNPSRRLVDLCVSFLCSDFERTLKGAEILCGRSQSELEDLLSELFTPVRHEGQSQNGAERDSNDRDDQEEQDCLISSSLTSKKKKEPAARTTTPFAKIGFKSKSKRQQKNAAIELNSVTVVDEGQGRSEERNEGIEGMKDRLREVADVVASLPISLSEKIRAEMARRNCLSDATLPLFLPPHTEFVDFSSPRIFRFASDSTLDRVAKICAPVACASKINLAGCCRLRDAAVCGLLTNVCSSGLTFIDLSKCSQLTDTTLRCVANHHGASLRVLCLKGVTLASDNALCELVEHTRVLESLDLSETCASDRCMVAVSQSCPLLRTLVLSRCVYISDKGLNSVIRACRSLEEVTVVESYGISFAFVSQLSETRPNIAVHAAFKTNPI